jgi:hypothetical protein
VNIKWLFEGGVPDETYGQGVKRRVRSAAIVWTLGLGSLALTYGAFILTGATWPTVIVAALCGVACSRVDLQFDPVNGEAPKKADQLIWLILFVPALVLSGAVSIYSALHVRDGFDVFKAGLLAWLFGCVLGVTFFMLRREGSRARA